MDNFSKTESDFLDINFVAEVTRDIIDFGITAQDNEFCFLEEVNSPGDTKNPRDIELLAEQFFNDLIEEYGLGEGSYQCRFNSIATDNDLKVLCMNANGSTIAIIHLNIFSNRIRMEFLDNILPVQEYITPENVNKNVVKQANVEKWQTEYGGRNQFNGNIEIRYKDLEDKAMAAIISTPSGHVETVVEYQYKNGKKSHMIHTGELGRSITTYDTEGEHVQLTNIDIDIYGNITSITKRMDNYILYLSGFDNYVDDS